MTRQLLLFTIALISASWSQSPIDLGTAIDFTALAKSGISATGTTAIVGDIGVSPIAAAAITGFALVLDSTGRFSISSRVTGRVYAANYAPPTPAKMTAAVGDMEAAYAAAAAGQPGTVSGLGSGHIGGLSLAPGVYRWSTGVDIATNVYLSGVSSSSVWIFQIAHGLTVSSSARVVIAGGGMASRVFWQVGGAVTLGTKSHIEGIVLCLNNISLTSRASVTGRLLAQTAITLVGSALIPPPENPPPPPAGVNCTARGCLVCNATTCSSCMPGRYLVRRSTCSPCIRGCLACNSTTCSACMPGWRLARNGTCAPCIDDCLACNATTCLGCAAGMHLVGDGRDSMCEPCVLGGGCLACDYRTGLCDECPVGAHIDDLGCAECGTRNCETCDPDTGACLTCVAGTHIVRGRCPTCRVLRDEDDGCIACSQVTGECTECAPGMHLRGNSCHHRHHHGQNIVAAVLVPIGALLLICLVICLGMVLDTSGDRRGRTE
jgi:hypothetical protein